MSNPGVTREGQSPHRHTALSRAIERLQHRRCLAELGNELYPDSKAGLRQLKVTTAPLNAPGEAVLIIVVHMQGSFVVHMQGTFVKHTGQAVARE